MFTLEDPDFHGKFDDVRGLMPALLGQLNVQNVIVNVFLRSCQFQFLSEYGNEQSRGQDTDETRESSDTYVQVNSCRV